MRSRTNSGARPTKHRELRRRTEQRDHRPEQQRPGDDDGELADRLGEARTRELDVGAPAVLVRVVGDRQHHQDRHQRARQDAGEEERADRGVGHHPVDHERQARRNDRAERRRRRGDADRELGRVAVLLHRLDLDRAEPGGVGDRGAAHAGEDHRADDVDVAEPALHPADQSKREVVDAGRDAGVVHQVAGEDEERHGEQREAVDAAHHPVDDDEGRQVAREQDVGERSACHGDGHRQPAAHEEQEEDLQHRGLASRQRASSHGPLEHAVAAAPVDACHLHRTERHRREAEQADAVDDVHRRIDDGHPRLVADLQHHLRRHQHGARRRRRCATRRRRATASGRRAAGMWR